MSTTEATAPKPLRADAERNRQRILAAAAKVFAARGLGASLDDVAAEAGVGVGTVYRRFPDKEALVDDLFQAKIEEVAALARIGLETDDSWEGVAGFIRGVCAMQATDRGLKEALLCNDRGRDLAGRARETVGPLVAELIARAKHDGHLRQDVEQFDLPMINVMISFVAEVTSVVSDDYWERPLQIVLDGLRADGREPTPLTTAPLTAEQHGIAMSQGLRRR